MSQISLYINTSSAHLAPSIFFSFLTTSSENLSKYLLFCLSPALLSSCTHKHINNKFVSDKVNSMSSRRSRSIQSGPSRNFTEEQMTDLIFKLQQLIPEICNRRSGKVTASKVLQETCNYIRSLQREVEDLSSRLSELLSSADVSHAQAAIIKSLFMNTSL